MVGFGLVRIGSVALVLDIESGASELDVHIGTTCMSHIELHWSLMCRCMIIVLIVLYAIIDEFLYL